MGVAVLVGITGLSYVLAGAAAQPGDAKSAVDFTPDGKVKRPVGYRKWVYVGELVTSRSQGGEAPFPEFHAVYMDPETPLYFCNGRLLFYCNAFGASSRSRARRVYDEEHDYRRLRANSRLQAGREGHGSDSSPLLW